MLDFMKFPGNHFLFRRRIAAVLLGIGLLSGCGERKVVVPDSWKNRVRQKISHELSAPPRSEKELEARGFRTNRDFDPEGDPRARKGGFVTLPISDFPPTYRTLGKDTHLVTLSLIEGLVYESLLSLDPKTLEYRPGLADWWRISPDRTEYRFRIDPRARWSDGRPVRAEDVVATFGLLTDPGIQDPAISALFARNFDPPVAEDERTVRVRCLRENWRSFMYFSGMAILPAHHIDKVNGASFLRKYQFQMMPGTGPYRLDLDRTRKGKKLILERRPDYWAKDFPANRGLFNFDWIRMVVVRDDRLMLEKFKKGEFDLYIPSRASWWVEELNAERIPEIDRGMIIKRKIFNFKPLGMSGFALNTLEPPFDDIRVRRAFSMLWNVDQLIDKLFFGEYVRCRSFFQGTVYENPENAPQVYDPERAITLLREAGFQRAPGEPWLERDGERFEIDLMIEHDPSLVRIFTPFQQDLKRAGIKLNLVNMTGQAVFERVMKRRFTIAYLSWTGLLFPNPETSMHSRYAEQPETNNITGIRNPRVDAICERYDKSYDVDERIRLLRELDGIVTREYHYAFGWVAPYAARLVFWNKFGIPEKGLSYSGDWRSLFALWWVDPEKRAALEHARMHPGVRLPRGKTVIDPWGKRPGLAAQNAPAR